MNWFAQLLGLSDHEEWPLMYRVGERDWIDVVTLLIAQHNRMPDFPPLLFERHKGRSLMEIITDVIGKAYRENCNFEIDHLLDESPR
jgi:hypothetical protein